MSDDEAFLATIYAAPDDDLPRLVYADWLDERGDGERAEFIRLQCRGAAGERLNYAESDRISNLAALHGPEWSAHLPREDRARWLFRRGFPEELEIDLGSFLERHEFWAGLPRVRHLVLFDATALLAQLLPEVTWNPNWVGLKFLDDPRAWMHGHRTMAHGGVGLPLSPQVAQLRELGFAGYGLNARYIQALCDSPYLAGLTVLEVPRKDLADPRLVARFGPILRANF